MGKYYVDWNDIRPEEAGILIDAVARYASVNISTHTPLAGRDAGI